MTGQFDDPLTDVEQLRIHQMKWGTEEDGDRTWTIEEQTKADEQIEEKATDVNEKQCDLFDGQKGSEIGTIEWWFLGDDHLLKGCEDPMIAQGIHRIACYPIQIGLFQSSNEIHQEDLSKRHSPPVLLSISLDRPGIESRHNSTKARVNCESSFETIHPVT